MYTEDLSAAIIKGSSMDRTFLLVLILLGLIILVKREIDWHQVVEDNRWLFILFLYMLASILWSDYQYVSLKRWIKTSGTLVMALVVLTGPSPIKTIESIFSRTAFILIPFSALLVKYFPFLGANWGRYSGDLVWRGVATGKNALGALCMISVFFLFRTWVIERKYIETHFDNYERMATIIVMGLSFWLMRGPGGVYSATSTVVLIVGVICFLILRGLDTNTNLEAMAIFLLLALGLTYLLMWGVLSINPVEVVASLTGRDATLTGRDQIWAQVMDVAKDNPVIGVGYGGYWINPLEFGKLTVNQAHNGYIDVFVEIGLVGLILLAVVIVMFFRKAADDFKFDIERGSLLITFLLMSLMHNITESTFLKSTAFLWNVFIMLMVAFSREMTSEQLHPKQAAKDSDST